MKIIVKNILVKIYHSIRLVKSYHSLFWQIYRIITTKLPAIKPKLALEMFFNALNNLARPNGLVIILLVFSTYLCMTDMDAPSSTIN